MIGDGDYYRVRRRTAAATRSAVTLPPAGDTTKAATRRRARMVLAQAKYRCVACGARSAGVIRTTTPRHYACGACGTPLHNPERITT